MEIPETLIEKVRAWLGDEGQKHFQAYQDEFGTVSPVYSIPRNKGPRSGGFPHPVHFREGMQVRNFLRKCEECVKWDDHELDDNWADVVTKAIAVGV